MADARWEDIKEPDVRAGAGKLDVAEALAADFAESDFNATLVADNTAMLHALVFAAEALPVSNRSENSCAEKPVALGFERTVVDGLWLGDFAMRPAANLLRAGKLNLDGVEVGDGTG